MTEDQITLVERSIKLLGGQTEAFITRFYEILFARHADMREMFSDTDMGTQRRKMLLQIIMIVDNLRDAKHLQRSIHEISYRHKHDYKAESEHYVLVRDAMLAAFPEFLGDEWTPETEKAWHLAIDQISDIMLESR